MKINRLILKNHHRFADLEIPFESTKVIMVRIDFVLTLYFLGVMRNGYKRRFKTGNRTTR